MKELSRKINYSNQTLSNYLYGNNKKEADNATKTSPKIPLKNGFFENGKN
jgi:hypothetical protein